MKLFFKYLKTKRNIIAFFIIAIIIFVTTFALYHIPVKAVLYPAILCFALGIGFLIFSFFRVKRQHDILESLKDRTAEMIGNLPVSNSICEDDYRELLELIRQESIDNAQAARFEFDDMVDYYTVWAHQIKTPISSMKLTLQNEDSDLSRRLSIDLFRTQQYVDMVLAFLRLGSTSSDYVFREHSLDEMIKSSVKKFAPEFIERHLTLCYEEVEKTIVTDEKWFEFLIEQLLSNALKYTKEGSITIALDGDNLTISDTGIGISETDLPRVFDKGYTGFNGRTEKGASGLGLYLSKRIATNLGLDIKVESTVGVGTKVILDLTQKKLKFE
ncbi:MAG: sensor histidine kinase [Clostridia bacterium]|nr:sensor histidine kinase [Clostridia bacterium]